MEVGGGILLVHMKGGRRCIPRKRVGRSSPVRDGQLYIMRFAMDFVS